MQSVVAASVAGVAFGSYTCPGSPAGGHASMKVTVEASASCSAVQEEIEARVQGDWVDPHNGGIYSLLSSSDGLINTQRTTNPATSVGGVVYTDKQTFVLTSTDAGCKIEGCSESQGGSFSDFSTNYCDLRNLYCGSADGCTSVKTDFTSQEESHTGSLGAGHDASKCIVAAEAALESSSYTCPGSPAGGHASMKVTVEASASCSAVQEEIEARVQGDWVDPHNGGIYSLLSSSDGLINTQRTTNPATSVGGVVYTDKQTFVLTSTDGGCKIEGCSESQGGSFSDFSTNYCDLRNLYCGSADGCTSVKTDFTSQEESHTGSLGAGHDASKCVVAAEAALESSSYTCPGSPALSHASMKVTVEASASCSDVQGEIEARVKGDWVDPHNGGVYSLLSSSDGLINTQRTTNPATSVGGVVYTDKQTFVLTSTDGGCKIEGCSESQGGSFSDFSTNYCDLRNLYCGSSDGCVTVTADFTSQEDSHKGSLGAGHDASKCIVAAEVDV